MSATTPWGLVHKVGLYYESCRQQKVDARYRAFNRTGPEDASRNWKHFSRAADVIWEHKIDPQEYITAQFVTATRTVYPYPTNLYSSRAFENWQRLNFMPRLRDAWEHNNFYLGVFMRRFGMSASEVVINPFWDWFAPWFRIAFLKDEDLPLYAEEGLKSLRSESVRRLLEEVGEDVADLERRLLIAKEKLS